MIPRLKVHNINQTPKLDDDQVDYAEVNHNIIMRPSNINSEVGKCKISVVSK